MRFTCPDMRPPVSIMRRRLCRHSARIGRPECDQGDVRHLPCENGYFDGYWAFRVIEHLHDGYDAIVREIQRARRPGGYLFLSFPSFNPFRLSRAAAGKYSQFPAIPGAMPDFYKFPLNPSDVQANLEYLGFEQVGHRGTSSLMSLAEDWRLAADTQHFLDLFPSRIGTGGSMAMDILIGRYAGHSCLLILRKSDSLIVSLADRQ